MEDIIWVASFDIGKKNFSFYIEEFSRNELINIPKIPKKNMFNMDGTCSEIFQETINKVFLNGKKILLENVDLTENCDQRCYLDSKTFYNMTELLDSYIEYWEQCDVFLIEKQMSFGKRHNTMAIKLGQHCWSYFSLKYDKEIIEFPAYHKTQLLGCKKDEIKRKGIIKYKGVDKPKRKKWCISKALEILEYRNDVETYSQIKNSKKKDDLSDVICQLQAYKLIII